jgi:DNA topoisomerase-1
VDPVSGAPVVVKDGRFGPYVTDGTTNATLRKDDAVESVTLERAAELLAEKRTRTPAPKRGAQKSAARKTTTKKAAAKTATKTTTKKAAATAGAAKSASKSAPRSARPQE